MDEARASWNTVYVDENGFECQLTLRDEDEQALAERVASITARLLEKGSQPVARHARNATGDENGADGQAPAAPAGGGSSPEKAYVDGKGMRRCNLKLKNGRRCNQPVTEKEGRYGLFWSCPNYKEHAPTLSR